MLEALNAILQKCGSQVMPATLNCQMLAEIENPVEVYTRTKAFFTQASSGCTGWLCFTDKVQIVPNDFCFADDDGLILLSGELVQGNESLHIRQSGSGWQIFKLDRVDGGDMMMFEESFLSIRKGGQKLGYENYWRKVENAEGLDVYQPFVSRFAGFIQGGK